jgi:glutamyl-tRNA synthetase
MTLRGRFAPSPTGLLHLGNARTALLAWLQVREAGGAMVLRVEDLDTRRVRPGAEAEQLRDLAWLGLDWDEGPDVGGRFGPYRQSARLAHYQAALARLPHYPCSCSRKDIELAASAPHDEPSIATEHPNEGQERRYPGTCAHGVRNHNRPLAQRLRTPGGIYGFDDALYGQQQQDVAAVVGDFVLARNDGVFSYQLAVVVDDITMGISHVLRGADLLGSTPRQLCLYQLLGAAPPSFTHVPLLTDIYGQRLAKRNGAVSLAALRQGGASPREVVRDLAQSLGWKVEHPVGPQELLGQWHEYLGQAQKNTRLN